MIPGAKDFTTVTTEYIMTFHMQLTGYVGGSTFNCREVRRVLGQYPGKHVDILIESFGGSLPEGLSICGAFRDHGDVTVHLRGMNASAATLASMGAKKVIIAPEGMYLVHKVSMGFFDWADRNSDQLSEFIKLLQSQKEDLDTMDRSIAELYASRCKRPAKDLLSLMKAEKWITATEAKTWGFADEITSITDDQDSKPAPSPGNAAGTPTSITRAQAEGFRMLGLPLPPVAIETDDKSFVSELVHRIVEPIKSLLTKNNDMNPTHNQQPEEQTGNPSAQSVVQEPGATPQPDVQPTAENVQNGDASAAQSELERLRAENAALKAKIPAAATTNVLTQPTAPQNRHQPETPFEKFINTGARAKKLFDSLP